MTAGIASFGRAAAWMLVAAAAACIIFIALGAAVSGRPPGPVDNAAATYFFGQATPLAGALTTAGRFPAYAAFSAAGILLGSIRRALLPRAIVAVIALILAWLVSDAFKALFHRARPPHWLLYHETSASYPSGHAVNVLTFAGVWFAGLLVARPSPWRVLGLAALLLWVLGTGWSRLALGAHYLSDVVGGYCLGLTLALVAALITRHFENSGQAAPAPEVLVRRTPAG